MSGTCHGISPDDAKFPPIMKDSSEDGICSDSRKCLAIRLPQLSPKGEPDIYISIYNYIKDYILRKG